MQTIVNFGLAKAGMRSTLHTAVRYGPQSLRGIRIFDPLVIQGASLIDFLTKHYWKSTTYIPLRWAYLSTLQLEAVRRGSILENNYT